MRAVLLVTICLLAKRVLRGEKIYSFHVPEVECISKGKAHKRYEYGNKVSVTMNVAKNKGGCFVLHTKSLHGNPYDGHALKEVLEETQDLIGNKIKIVYADKGYKGYGVQDTTIYLSGQKRRVYGQIKRELKRRKAIEPIISHMKNGCRMAINYLKGILGDKLNAIFAAIGFKFRQIAKYFREVFLYLIQSWYSLLNLTQIPA
ncbi:MAG: transposase family protein [Rickettsiaceae bacterium]|jgi:IS5 family transposase|nr:transposase family protein [Rickettsiaceae bacterium]